jgi:hypothetical protein
VDTNFADKSICLLADNIGKEVVTIHRSQVVLKMLFLCTYLVDIHCIGGRGSDIPFETVLQENLQFSYDYFLLVLLLFWVTVVKFLLQTTPKGNITRIKIR